MVDVSSQSNKVNITVSSSGVSSNVNASGDTSHYYSEKAREWAISNRIVDGVDYSSKYYAEKSNQSSLNAQSFAQSAQDSYKQFQNSVDDALSTVNDTVQGAITTIDTKSDEAIETINNSVDGVIEDINKEFEEEKQEIEDLANLIKENAEDIANRTSFAMFDTILKDHILTYEQSKGWALQGTYVYKEAVAGSRYGYPDFYAKCLEERNTATATEVTLGDSTITMYIASNGHQFYDIANKDVVDTFFGTVGSAWFYGVDIENERIFLPRNNYFEQATGDVSETGKSVEAGLPNITGKVTASVGSTSFTSTGALVATEEKQIKNIFAAGSGLSVTSYNIDASLSNPVYGNSETVQPSAVKKLLYICVGNTINYEGTTEVVNQGMEILEQVNQGIESRVNLDATNISAEGKSLISSFAMPSNRYVDLTLGASNTTYIAPANGWVSVYKNTGGTQQYLHIRAGYCDIVSHADRGSALALTLPVRKGQQFIIGYSASGVLDHFRFIYAEGEE